MVDQRERHIVCRSSLMLVTFADNVVGCSFSLLVVSPFLYLGLKLVGLTWMLLMLIVLIQESFLQFSL